MELEFEQNKINIIKEKVLKLLKTTVIRGKDNEFKIIMSDETLSYNLSINIQNDIIENKILNGDEVIFTYKTINLENSVDIYNNFLLKHLLLNSYNKTIFKKIVKLLNSFKTEHDTTLEYKITEDTILKIINVNKKREITLMYLQNEIFVSYGSFNLKIDLKKINELKIIEKINEIVFE